MAMRSFCFEEKGSAASGLLSLTNPASHKACRSALKLVIAKEDVLTVSKALELALFMDAKLDLSKVPAK